MEFLESFLNVKESRKKTVNEKQRKQIENNKKRETQLQHINTCFNGVNVLNTSIKIQRWAEVIKRRDPGYKKLTSNATIQES